MHLQTPLGLTLRLHSFVRSSCCLFAIFTTAFLGAEEDSAFFESRVRPLLVEHCYRCHSGVKTSGGLSLETRQGWQAGGESGPALVPGNPEESLLLQAVRGVDGMQMPPEGEGRALTADEIAVLADWISRGAPDPRVAEQKSGGMDAEQAATWWAFQPLPEQGLTSAEIDSLIDAKLAESSLTASPPADRRTWIRRATYDLTGLPPSVEEVEAFIADPAPDAFAKVIDRLLASPQYGVQWGRHWLDVVRYADTAGENTDRPLPHAWRYRNWVFDCFNRDVAYNEFVKMQLAGDLLRSDRGGIEFAEGVTATGYLAIARRFGHDIDNDVHLMHEDVIDNLGKAFLGLTIACARCHDHKYDAITAADYYALYGIFDSTQFAFPGCEAKGQPRDLVSLMNAAEAAEMMRPWQEQQKRHEAQLAAITSSETESSTRLREASQTCRMLASANLNEGSSLSLSETGGASLEAIEVRKGEAIRLTVLPQASHGADSTLVEWEISDVADPGRTWSVADLIPRFLEGNPPGLDSSGEPTWFFLQGGDTPALLAENADRIADRPELQAWRNGSEPSVFVNTSEEAVDVWTRLPAKTFFVHPGPDLPVAVAWVSPIDGTIRIRGRVADAHPSQGDGVAFALEHVPAPEFGAALTTLGTIAQERQQSARRFESEAGPQPTVPVAFAVTEGTIHNTPLQQRGDPTKPGEVVPRRWLSVFGGETVASEDISGRRELAEWITQNPLSARVMVNRIWQGHFDAGLTRTPNDFGARGEAPSHPELLDRLAATFRAEGYGVKAMHRLIMNTAAYQRSSTADEQAATADPENRLLSRFNRRRLAAEELRDSLLLVSGELDLFPGEQHPFPPESTWTFTQHNPFNAVYDSRKRSAYLMVQRQRRHPFLALFDGADPNASTAGRQTTTVPTQALYFLNDDFFHQSATRTANRLAEPAGDRERIGRVYQALFQRAASDKEIAGGSGFLAAYPADIEEKWAAYLRVLLASNEFISLD